MRQRAYLEKILIQARSDLVKARLENDWANGLVNYLLGQVVTLEIVLDNTGLDWTTVYQVTMDQIDYSVAEIQKRSGREAGDG